MSERSNHDRETRGGAAESSYDGIDQAGTATCASPAADESAAHRNRATRVRSLAQEQSPVEREEPAALAVEQLSVRFILHRAVPRRSALSRPKLPGRFRDKTAEVTVDAVTEASFALRPGRLLALVGESGCGKSVLASALLGLLPANAQVRGSAWLGERHDGVDLIGANERELARTVRGRRLALVPQAAHGALTPTRTAGDQLAETVRVLGGGPNRVADLADRVGLPRGDLERYPHELSGGMAQRVVLALALAGEPEVIIADEPTSGLDRALVERVVDELRSLAEAGTAVLMITHDVAAAERVATDLAVMYASRLVEVGPAADVLTDPWHTYTAELLDALPDRGFHPIPGHPPDLTALPAGCAYAQRSRRHAAVCSGDPRLSQAGARHVACGIPSVDGRPGEVALVHRVRGAGC